MLREIRNYKGPSGAGAYFIPPDIDDSGVISGPCLPPISPVPFREIRIFNSKIKYSKSENSSKDELLIAEFFMMVATPSIYNLTKEPSALGLRTGSTKTIVHYATHGGTMGFLDDVFTSLQENHIATQATIKVAKTLDELTEFTGSQNVQFVIGHASGQQHYAIMNWKPISPIAQLYPANELQSLSIAAPDFEYDFGLKSRSYSTNELGLLISQIFQEYGYESAEVREPSSVSILLPSNV
jgi:hypothetical protein